MSFSNCRYFLNMLKCPFQTVNIETLNQDHVKTNQDPKFYHGKLFQTWNLEFKLYWKRTFERDLHYKLQAIIDVKFSLAVLICLDVITIERLLISTCDWPKPDRNTEISVWVSVFGCILNQNFGRNRKFDSHRNRHRNSYRNRSLISTFLKASLNCQDFHGSLKK